MTGQSTFPVGDRTFHDSFDGGRDQPISCQQSSGEMGSVQGEINALVDQANGRLQSPLLAMAFGPTRIVRSSLCSPWQSIILERHLYSPGERKSASIDKHVISMAQSFHTRFEHRNLSGEFVESLTRQKSIMISPAGPVPDIRLHTPAGFIHCALDEEFTQNVREELDQPAAKPIFRVGIEDKAIQRILGMLMDELEAGRPFGRLYVDSLAHALATRYVQLDGVATNHSRSRPHGLLPRKLSRVREKIEANLDADLSLENLAEESGYSRAHFLRMFRAATGLTPHHYVLDLRLRRAQERLGQAGSSIIDVAVSCGFSSQSHMTSAFRQHLETTPGEYRRNALGSKRQCWS